MNGFPIQAESRLLKIRAENTSGMRNEIGGRMLQITDWWSWSAGRIIKSTKVRLCGWFTNPSKGSAFFCSLEMNHFIGSFGPVNQLRISLFHSPLSIHYYSWCQGEPKQDHHFYYYVQNAMQIPLSPLPLRIGNWIEKNHFRCLIINYKIF